MKNNEAFLMSPDSVPDVDFKIKYFFLHILLTIIPIKSYISEISILF